MNKSISASKQGFTIVELLIVIVVIAILAAISIVAYNGIQARGKNSAAQSSATAIVKKAEIYKVEVGNYPLGMSNLTGAPSTATYYVTGIVYGGSLSNSTPTNAVTTYVCGSGSPTSAAGITTSNITGGLVYYRDYQNSTNLTAPYGINSGTGIACYASI